MEFAKSKSYGEDSLSRDSLMNPTPVNYVDMDDGNCLLDCRELEEAFGMNVWDRYSVVLGIFQHNAHTKEAKLQVALAELPYIRFVRWLYFAK